MAGGTCPLTPLFVHHRSDTALGFADSAFTVSFEVISAIMVVREAFRVALGKGADMKSKILKTIRLPIFALAGVMLFVGAPRAEAKHHNHHHHDYDSNYYGGYPYDYGVYPYGYGFDYPYYGGGFVGGFGGGRGGFGHGGGFHGGGGGFHGGGGGFHGGGGGGHR